MTEIRFYHLRTKSAEQALPELLSRVLDQGRRAVVRVPDDDAAARLDEYLWIWRPESFLPHGKAGDPRPDAQPVWITAGDDNPAGADVLFLTGGAGSGDIGSYALCCALFDGHDESAVAAARQGWKSFTAQGFAVAYWQQSESGGWERKS